MTKRWTHEERVWLKLNYGQSSTAECVLHLSKSAEAIRNQVSYLRKRGWTFDSTRRK